MLINDPFVLLPVNLKGQDYFVGDLHGQDVMLEALLAAMGFDPETDRLIAVGDLIDRGPGSVRLLEMLDQEPWFYSVIGNHELMMRGGHPVEGDPDWFDLYGRETNDQILSQGRVPGDYFHVLNGMPKALEVPLADGRRVGVIHAEVAHDGSWDEIRNASKGPGLNSSVFWGRKRALAAMTALYDREAMTLQPEIEPGVCSNLWPVTGIDLLISGHTPMSACVPVAAANMLFIDTGACFDGSDGGELGRLTLVNPLQGKYWQARRAVAEGRFEVFASALPTPVTIADVRPSLEAVLSSMALRPTSYE